MFDAPIALPAGRLACSVLSWSTADACHGVNSTP
jgi:hypothetical protein